MQYNGNNMLGVKRSNRSAVLRLLHEQGGMSRKRLAEKLRLTPAAITKITAEMLEDGLLVEGKSIKGSGAGRREINVQLAAYSYCALGMFINLRQVILSAVWLDGSVIFSEEITTDVRQNAEELAERLSSRLLELAEHHGIPKEKILGIGLAVRGITSEDCRIVSNSFGVLDRTDCPLPDMIEKAAGLPVTMANNVRALLAAHVFMSGEGDFKSRFFLRCEYGIGAALSIDRKIWHGATQQCAEIGHIPVIRRGGKPCSCGKSGCLETIASPAAILEDSIAALSERDTPVLWRIKESKSVPLDLDDVFSAARSGDAVIAEIVDRAISAFSYAIKTVIYTVDPDEIVLYGRMFNNDYYLSKLLAETGEGLDSTHCTIIQKSRFNRLLEDKAACLLYIDTFMENGGMK